MHYISATWTEEQLRTGRVIDVVPEKCIDHRRMAVRRGQVQRAIAWSWAVLVSGGQSPPPPTPTPKRQDIWFASLRDCPAT